MDSVCDLCESEKGYFLHKEPVAVYEEDRSDNG